MAAAAECDNSDRANYIVDDVYVLDLGERSVELVRLARAGRTEALEGRVSPTFDFILEHGDVRIGARNVTGIDAFDSLARRLGPGRYEIAARSTVPIASSVCGRQTATVTFRDTERQMAWVVTFAFEGQTLVSANGYAEFFREGMIEAAE
jgi:hypothetical protein